MAKPTYGLIKKAFSPGEVIYVLNAESQFRPVKVLSIEKKSFQTEKGEVLYEDHGWLWKCFEPKGKEAKL